MPEAKIYAPKQWTIAQALQRIDQLLAGAGKLRQQLFDALEDREAARTDSRYLADCLRDTQKVRDHLTKLEADLAVAHARWRAGLQQEGKIERLWK
jgi:hypothetical protein